MKPKALLSGHDTVECAYYLRATGGDGAIDFDNLRVLKESIRQDKKRQPKAIILGGVEFYLLGQGSASGYPLLIQNRDCAIAFGEFNSPSFYVTFRSEALWREGAQAIHRRFMAWAEGLGLRAFKDESISRTDFTFDFEVLEADFDADSVVSLSAKDASFRKERRTQTIQFGAGGASMLRIYNKSDEIAESSGKVWFIELWGGTAENVWRVEWQVRKDMLRRFGIRTFEDLADMQGDLLTYLAHEHDTLRTRTEDTNRSRWPLHPLWLELQTQVKRLPREGVQRSIDPADEINARLLRAGIAVYGYLKHVGAMTAALRGADFIGKEEALQRLLQLIAQFHDPMTWKNDVERRVIDVRLSR